MSEVNLGVLDQEISPVLVDEVVEAAGRRERRRPLLPARVVVYFVLALCLFSGADSAAPPGYRSVMRSLSAAVRGLHGLVVPSSAALTTEAGAWWETGGPQSLSGHHTYQEAKQRQVRWL